MAVKFDFNFSEIDGIVEVFGSIEQEFNLSGCEPEIDVIFAEAGRLQFSSQGKRGGSVWEQLKDGSGRQPLVKTDDLREAIINPKSVLEDDGKRIVVKFDSTDHARLAAIHQFGATIKRVSSKGKNYTIEIPARPVFQPTEGDLDRVQRVALDKLITGIGKKLNSRKKRAR